MFAASNKTAAISIHAPREGGDDDGSPAWQAFFQFQSTPPARGATQVGAFSDRKNAISIHAPREGGDNKLNNGDGAGLVISIHAPREGGDTHNGETQSPHQLFQSTPPARGATSYGVARVTVMLISIHAPREGGDVSISIVAYW